MKVQIKNVRLSYPNLFTAKAMNEGDKPKYSCAFIMDRKANAKDIAAIQKAVDTVIKEKWPKGAPKGLKIALRSGEEKDVEGYGEQVMFINASCDTRPAVVDQKVQPVTKDDNVVYAGCYVNASVDVWAQDNNYGKRVNCKLLAVQFAKKGEPFGEAPVDASKEFTEVEEDETEDITS